MSTKEDKGTKDLDKKENKGAANTNDDSSNSPENEKRKSLDTADETRKDLASSEFYSAEELSKASQVQSNESKETNLEVDKTADLTSEETKLKQEEMADADLKDHTTTLTSSDASSEDATIKSENSELTSPDSPITTEAEQFSKGQASEESPSKITTVGEMNKSEVNITEEKPTPSHPHDTASLGDRNIEYKDLINDLEQWYNKQLDRGSSLIEIADSKISILEHYLQLDNLATINISVLEEKINRAKYIVELLSKASPTPTEYIDDFVAETDEEKRELRSIQSMLKRADKILAEAQTLWNNIPRTDPQEADKYYFSDAGGPIAEEHQPEELSEQDISDEDLTEDATARAYEVGVGSELDNYDREILAPVFENHLRMSINPLKYNYSKLKNKIMSYSGITQKFTDFFEVFRANRKVIIRLSVYNDKLYFYCALPLDSLDKTQYPHKKAKGTHEKSTPIVFTITDEASLNRVLEVLTLVIADNNLKAKTHYTPIAYAERYPLNPNAVVSGFEHNPPFSGEFSDDFNYAPITGEIVDGIIKALVRPKERKEPPTAKEQLEDIRQIAKTIKASVALTEPIVYFYDAAIDSSNVVQYINVQQVLNDKFLGKIVPQTYFAIAEGSAHITTFNFLALDHVVELANASPNYRFVMMVSVRLLHKKNTLERLIKNARTNNGNLILAFDCALLESSGDIGINAINKLRNESGVMIMLDNAENAGMRALTEYSYEYLRFDARYYSQDHPKKQAHLRMLVEYCKTQNIRSTSINAMNTKEAQVLVASGVEIIQGFAVSEPKRNITIVVRTIKKIPPM